MIINILFFLVRYVHSTVRHLIRAPGMMGLMSHFMLIALR